MKWDLDSSTCIKLHLDSNMQTWSEDLASGLCIFCGPCTYKLYGYVHECTYGIGAALFVCVSKDQAMWSGEPRYIMRLRDTRELRPNSILNHICQTNRNGYPRFGLIVCQSISSRSHEKPYTLKPFYDLPQTRPDTSRKI